MVVVEVDCFGVDDGGDGGGLSGVDDGGGDGGGLFGAEEGGDGGVVHHRDGGGGNALHGRCRCWLVSMVVFFFFFFLSHFRNRFFGGR